jgi:hypothetical protein
MGMFTTGVFVLSMSGFGPIADNAGGTIFLFIYNHLLSFDIYKSIII